MTINKGITSNPSIRLHLLKKIAKQFEGYIAGLGGDNRLSIFTTDKMIKEALAIAEQSIDQKDNKAKKEIDDAIDKILNTILDGSQGAYLSSDYVRLQKIYNADRELTIAKSPDMGRSKFIKSLTIFSEPGLISNMKTTKPWDETQGEVMGTQVITPTLPPLIVTPTQNSKIIEKKKKLKEDYTQDSFGKLDEKERIKLAGEVKLSPAELVSILPKKKGDKKSDDNLVLVEVDESTSNTYAKKESYEKHANLNDMLKELPKNLEANYSNLIPSVNIDNGKIDSKTKMTAYVFCNKNVHRASRAKDVLNLFLNGIPPLEMSRCTPFLDIVIYHKNNSINKKKFMNHAFHMRFTKNSSSGNFELVDNNDITTAKRVDRGSRDDGLDESFMSIFTSPQVMSNANINKSTENIFDNFSTSNKEGLGDQKFLEPIIPLLSLSEFQVTIDGMGYGLVSSRKGSMSLVLHDRSRLSDFAPLVSLNQLSGTSMRIEFGWSHPDGDPISSDNPIGQFLNSCRDIQYYNLTGTNLSFQNNSVNIEVQLASAGTELMTGVSAAAGLYAPLNFLNKKINSLINDILIEQSSIHNQSKNNDTYTKIQKQLRVIRSSATSQTAVVETKDFEEIIKSFESKNKISNLSKLINISKTLGLIQSDPSSLSSLIELIEKRTEDYSSEKLKFTSDLIKSKIAAARLTTDFNFFETAVTDFQTKYVPNAEPATQGKLDLQNISFGDIGLADIETISFGKLIMYYCALPMLSTCEFADVQVMFYPINTSAAGARRFTTASLPIEYSIVRSAIDERFKTEGNMSVKGMFAFLANLFDNTGLGVYGIQSFDDFYNKRQERDNLTDDQIAAEKQEAINTYKSNQRTSSAELNPDEQKPDPELTEEEKEAIYKEWIRNKYYHGEKKYFSKRLTEIYNNDGITATSSEEIVTPLLNMHMEVVPVINSNINSKSFSAVDDFFFGAVRTEKEDGYIKDKKILRIHVYDARANGNPKGELLNKILNSDVADLYAGKIPADIDKSFLERKKALNVDGNKLSSLVSKIPTRELKYFVKRNYPNVTWGANSSVVKNLTVSSNTNDKVSQLIMIRRKAQERTGGASKNALSAEEEISINPSTVSLELFGCPFIDRGSQIFVDTGTGTDLDNVYTVNSITHRVKSGDFSTSVSLVLTAQGAITNTRRSLANKLKKIKLEEKPTTKPKATNPSELKEIND